MPKKTRPVPEVSARYSLNAAAAVAYEARRQLRILEGNRDEVPFEFLDNVPKSAFLDLCKQLRQPPTQDDAADDTETALMRSIIILLS